MVNVGLTRVVIVTFASDSFSPVEIGTKFTEENPIFVAISSLSDFAQMDEILKLK